jgi:hypothetical protein
MRPWKRSSPRPDHARVEAVDLPMRHLSDREPETLPTAGPYRRAHTTGAPVPSHSVHDLAAFLCGTWQLTRALSTVAGDRIGGLDGTATFAPAGDELAYLERGVLRLLAPPRELKAERRLRYRVAGWHAEVRFTDGRRFHDLDLRSGCWTAAHRCGDDRYVATVEAVDPDRFEQTWTVHGPAKAYVSRSWFIRRATARSADLGEQLVEP